MKRFLVAAAVAASVAASGHTPANAASFNCDAGNLSSAAERVCDSRWLTSLDERMDSWYRRALERARYFDQTAMVRSAQRDWISRRDSCGTSFWCIRRAYVTRIRELTNYVEHV